MDNVLRFLSRTPLRDLVPRDSPSPPAGSQGGSGNGARADVARKTKEIEHMLENLEKEGVQIDGKMASIIDDEIARIEPEAARKNIKEPRNEMLLDVVLHAITTVGLGFLVGAKWCDHVVRVRTAVIQDILFAILDDTPFATGSRPPI